VVHIITTTSGRVKPLDPLSSIIKCDSERFRGLLSVDQMVIETDDLMQLIQ
jgi:hypothetical protein